MQVDVRETGVDPCLDMLQKIGSCYNKSPQSCGFVTNISIVEEDSSTTNYERDYYTLHKQSNVIFMTAYSKLISLI